MNNYFKRFIILKRLSGRENCTLKIEGEKGVFTVCGELYSNRFNLDKYTLLYSCFNGEVKVFKLLTPRFEININGDVSRGFSALLCDKDTPILYGGYGECLSQNQLFISATKNLTENASYDDEVIATENYYEVESGEKDLHIEIDGRSCQDENNSPKEKEKSRTSLHEDANCNERQSYYLTVKDNLDGLINKFESDYALCSLIPNSKFVKINYDKDKFYSVGTILENQEVKYICYAVLGNYKDAPKQLKDFCEFLPLSPFTALGDGYYVIFQSATNGEIIKKA